MQVGVKSGEIGVIAPYMEQVRLLQTKLSPDWLQRTANQDEGSRVEVNTVDQYQGRDKSMIIVSMVRKPNSQAHVCQHRVILEFYFLLWLQFE